MRCTSIFAVFLFVASPAFAEDAKTLNKQGLDAAQAKNWELARQKFEQAFALTQEPLTLYNLAAAQEHTDRLITARTNYAKYLAQTKPGPDHDRFRAAAKTKLVALEKSIPTLHVKAVGFPSTALIELDQRSLLANELSGPFQLDPGPHVVVARRGTEVLARNEITIERGARAEVTLVAPPPKVEKPPPPPVVVQPPLKPIEKPPGGVLRSGWFWSATSLVLIGGAAAYYFLYYNRSDPTPGTLGRGVIEL